MKKMIKYILLVFSLLLFCSCKNEKDNNMDLNNSVIENNYNYQEMDKESLSITKENVTYNWTLYFEEDICINALVEVVFNSLDDANNYYENIKTDNIYEKIEIDKKTVTYLYDPETFEYSMYPKNMVIEHLKGNDLNE